jgi:undecaprenyl diphosphate synthase
MDGNGRWAVRRGLPRTAGHRAGAASVRALVEAAPAAGISVLTLYAFSSDNWRRPPAEVGRLMSLFAAALRRETALCVRHGIRLSVIGRRDRLPPALVAAIALAEQATRDGARLHLRVAVDYSARASILRALSLHSPGECSEDQFAGLLARAQHEQGPVPAVDLLIRTGGEQRLSDFLLWECAYAELVFTPTLWPDFRAPDLLHALAEFRRRDRRFGGVPLAASA